ncbi:MAG: histidine kinase, partial [Alistipes sp.]
KCSFAVVVTMLYGRIYVLISQRQAVVVENEQLKNENLTTRYNMLVSQINPHFFFNSLNSLAMLVREKLNDKALTYIDRLSYTFRYILQNGQSTLISLEEEVRFIEAYSYLFKVRYADKLFFDIAIDEKYRAWMLPAMSLQPLIGNAVKHNTITKNKPFHITIRTQDDYLIVSNPKVPKLEPEPGTGIGLENLRNRWHLITGRHIEVIDTGTEFIVRLPLQKPTVS